MTLTNTQRAPRSTPAMGSASLGAAEALLGAKVLHAGVDPSHGRGKDDPVGVW